VKLLLSLLFFAQAAPPPPAPAPAAPPPADTLVSPEVHPDRRVTFRLRAPRASDVAVAGEWARPGAAVNAPQKMARDAAGVWSITVGPVEPNIYIYVFQVDGMVLTDPVNPLVKLRARTSASMVEVPGGMPWEVRDVPHGVLETHTHASAVLGGATRQVVVYTPPEYQRNPGARYPIVYLLHGNNDLAVGWTMAGRANLVLDNLQAEKKAAPMIVVMPWGHALPFGARPAAGQPTNNDLFERYLLEDVVPLVEKRYRVASGRRNRAIVGLSMGGTQALQIGLRHRELFASIGMFGAGLGRADFEARYGELMKAPPTARNKLDFFFVGIAREDVAHARAKELAELLRGYGLPVTYHETDGGHTYPVWRKLLVQSVPLLFQQVSPKSRSRSRRRRARRRGGSAG
jgi:enterochelin esterase-like enzyme